MPCTVDHLDAGGEESGLCQGRGFVTTVPRMGRAPVAAMTSMKKRTARIHSFIKSGIVDSMGCFSRYSCDLVRTAV